MTLRNEYYQSPRRKIPISARNPLFGRPAHAQFSDTSAHRSFGIAEQARAESANFLYSAPADLMRQPSGIAYPTRWAGSDRMGKPESPQAGIVDRAVLAQLESDTSRDTLKHLIRAYVEETRPRIERMVRALARNDVTLLGRDAHSLKSSSQTFGAHKLGALAAELEEAIAEGRPQSAADIMDRLPQLARDSLDAFEALLAT
jgi:HPt (histidine-containing phosphotransfer) domain-containing protein